MNFFGVMYDKTVQWSRHRFAAFWLCFVSFIEAIFFPIPPDVMLIPMSMSKPAQAMKYAIYCTFASSVGGLVGYSIGHFASDWVQQLIINWRYKAYFDQALSWFKEYGILVVFVAGFSPVPYKIFTIAAGILQMTVLPFFITSFISRAARFILVAKLTAWGGRRFEAQLRKYIELIGWSVVVLVVIAYFILH